MACIRQSSPTLHNQRAFLFSALLATYLPIFFSIAPATTAHQTTCHCNCISTCHAGWDETKEVKGRGHVESDRSLMALSRELVSVAVSHPHGRLVGIGLVGYKQLQSSYHSLLVSMNATALMVYCGPA
jgi:hypothetical protein